MKFKPVIALTLALTVPHGAFAASGCLTAPEAEAMIQVLLPDAVTAAAGKCRTAVGPSGFLPTRGAALAQRWRSAADDAWPQARGALGKVTDPELAKLVDNDAGRKFISQAVVDGLVKDLKPRDCITADRIIGALEPLPAANVATIMTTILEASEDGKPGKAGRPTICPRSSS